MSLIDQWATRVAREATPDEVELAPIMAHAYLEGGIAREDLFRQSGSAVQGAFGAEVGIALFPTILAAIQHTPGLVEFFDVASSATGSSFYLVGAISTILNLGKRDEREDKKQELPDDTGIKEIHTRLREGIATVPNLDEDQADLITYRVLRTMLEDPSQAAAFAREIKKAT
jgi:hypothetical protein